jgi:hypothetical protein
MSLSTNENSIKLSFKIQENKNSSLTYEESSLNNNNICDICHKSFSTLGNMRNHKITIHQNYRPFKCTYPGCNKKYSLQSSFLVHLRTHFGEKPFICQICSKSFNEKGNLKTHLRFHSELRPFKCPQCDKSYKTNGHLKDHINIHHKLIKKFNCEFCGKKFGRISTLKSHIRTHNGEKNYKCKMEGCEKRFTEKGNMEIHYLRHLKKLNKIDEYEKIKKKKYGEKIIKQDFEERIKKAIDNLKDIKKIDIHQLNLEKTNELFDNDTKLFFLSKKNNYFKNNEINNKYLKTHILPEQLPSNNNANNDHIFNSNINNTNLVTQSNDKIRNNFIFINENNLNTNLIDCPNIVNNGLKNVNTLNIFNDYSSNENCINNDKENQNFLDCFPIYQPNQDFHQTNQMIDNENKIDLFKEIKDLSNCATRQCSNNDLCLQKKPENIFVKEKDLYSEEELSKNNNSQGIDDNSCEKENLIYNCNYPFFYDGQFLNEERMNNINYNENDINETKNLQKFQYIF